jgi:hypothetical protein
MASFDLLVHLERLIPAMDVLRQGKRRFPGVWSFRGLAESQNRVGIGGSRVVLVRYCTEQAKWRGLLDFWEEVEFYG